LYNEFAYITNQICGGNFVPIFKFFGLYIFPFIAPPLGFIFKALGNNNKCVTKEFPPMYNETYYKYTNEKWFFIGGAAHSEEIQKLNAAHVAKCFKRRVHTFYNPSHGFLFYLIKSLFARTFSSFNELDITVATKLLRTLKRNKNNRVIVIAHSDGGSVIGNALKLLARWDAPVERLEVYTFGSVAINVKSAVACHMEHFANVGDYIAKVGITDCKKERAGALFKCETNEKGEVAQGNMLGAHYLPNFEKRRYINKKNKQCRLVQYLDGNVAPALRGQEQHSTQQPINY